MNINYFSKIRILDGGMGQHLLAKGLKPKGSLWSTTALIDKKYHQLVVDTHLNFIESGADGIDRRAESLSLNSQAASASVPRDGSGDNFVRHKWEEPQNRSPITKLRRTATVYVSV